MSDQFSVLSDHSLVLSTHYIVRRLASYRDTRTTLFSRVGELMQENQELKAQNEAIDQAREFYQKAVDEVYAASLGEMEETLNMALEYIFYDKQYKVKLDMGDRRGKSIDILLTDASYDPPLEVDMRDGVGQGVRSVVSYVCTVYRILALGAIPAFWGDEIYSAISETYVDRFFSFVKSMCQAKGFALTIITHDPRFMLYGDRRYEVLDGRVTEVLDGEAEPREVRELPGGDFTVVSKEAAVRAALGMMGVEPVEVNPNGV